MKHQKILVFLLTMLPVIITSCSNDDEDEDLMGKWHRVSDFDGLARSEATSFTIGNKGYLTGGYDARKHLNDLWEYDMELDFWTQKASFPGTSRSSAAAKLLSPVLRAVLPLHFLLMREDTLEQDLMVKSIIKISGNMIRKRINGHRKLIFREVHAMMLQHLDYQTRDI